MQHADDGVHVRPPSSENATSWSVGAPGAALSLTQKMRPVSGSVNKLSSMPPLSPDTAHEPPWAPLHPTAVTDPSGDVAGLNTMPAADAATRDSTAAYPVLDPHGTGPPSGCGESGTAAPGWNAIAGRPGSHPAGRPG